ncbi:efflux RND transporter periplasmic adaptor subunit [Parasphingorhabdus sp.]|uniref:efflux RND transporter periplasmic adaptor subunit n=1 Tax=Parasphingorhabdus sp. TaxID=2709688 RepID=UPI002F95E68A
MTSRNKILVFALATVLVSAGVFYALSRNPAINSDTTGVVTAAKPGAISAAQIKKLGIRIVAAQAADAIPLGTVPAMVSLPPEARVAVAAPFDGTIVRLFVVEGQAVARGAALASVKAREPVQIGADLARARAQLDLAQANARRLNQLAREGIIAGARADEANAALHAAQINVSEYQRILSQAGAGGSGQMTLRAPIGGRVSGINVQTGGPVDTMTAPFLIENTSSYMLDIQLPERLAKKVIPGMTVELQLPGTSAAGEPVPVSGTIISVSPSLDPMTRSVMAKARIGAAPGIVAGKSLLVTINGDGSEAGVSVPAMSVTRIGDKDYVFVISDNHVAKREVTLVAQSGDSAILSAGLKAGEKVAASGIAELKVMLAED